mmetsp:Transcript_10372/g.30469  ORF Transcript_10372/g.30469 Transcript_10372/m.30469 type:complete len:231 (+) Transcript_10372:459-1151(+)
MRQDARARPPEVVYDSFGRSNVAAHPAKTLRERTHQNVHVRRIHPTMLAAAFARVAESTNGVGLIQIQIRLVLLRHFRDVLQVADLALHAINALDHDEDLAPRPPRPRSPVRDGLAQHLFERFRVVVLEGPDQGAGGPTPSDDRRVVELITDDQVTSSHQRRYGRRIRAVAHVEHDRVLLAHELRDFRFELPVEGCRAHARPRASTTRRPLSRRFEYGFSTSVHPVVGKS